MERPFRTLDEQIEILIGRKLVIDDIEGAKFLLTKHGYYSIINGYKDIFLKVKKSLTEDDCFKENVNFNEIINLYRFDVEIRNSILSALENIESTLQTNIAYILSDKYGDKQQDYLRPSNFRLGQRTRNGRMQRDVLLENLKAICIKDHHPMKHYRTRYSNVPPWILVKGLTFGNIIYIYKLFKKEDKESLISRCLCIPISEINEEVKQFFAKMLDIFGKYRNWAAHGGRIYSHKVKEELPFYLPLHNEFGITKKDYNKGRGKNDLMALFIGMFFFMESDFHGSMIICVDVNHALKYYKKENPRYYEATLEKMGFPLDYDNSLFEGKVRSLNRNHGELLARISLKNSSPDPVIK